MIIYLCKIMLYKANINLSLFFITISSSFVGECHLVLSLTKLGLIPLTSASSRHICIQAPQLISNNFPIIMTSWRYIFLYLQYYFPHYQNQDIFLLFLHWWALLWFSSHINHYLSLLLRDKYASLNSLLLILANVLSINICFCNIFYQNILSRQE